MLTGTCFYLHP